MKKKQIKKIIIAQPHPSLIPINILSVHEIYLFSIILYQALQYLPSSFLAISKVDDIRFGLILQVRNICDAYFLNLILGSLRITAH